MRILFLLLLSPSLIYARCGDCDEVYAEIERETEIDENYHACRTCRKVEFSMDNCPKFGFECSDKFGLSTNWLSATDDCQCLEARCADNAKLYVKTEFDEAPQTNPVNKMRCNNSEWMVNGVAVESAICAKYCNLGKCKASTQGFSTDFKELAVIPVLEGGSGCATALCPLSAGFALLNADGSYLRQLKEVDVDDRLTCSGSGKWTYGEGEEKTEVEHVMCNAANCGPFVCSANFVGANPELDLIPLTITGAGNTCAHATCPGNAFVALDANGDIIPHDFDGVPLLICTPDGTWQLPPHGPFPRVMCKQPSCSGNCALEPLEIPGTTIAFTKPLRKDCDYYCMGDQGLFFEDVKLGKPRAIRNATCASGRYQINSTVSAYKLGCFECRFDDGPISGPGEPRPLIDRCVISCGDGYKLEYYVWPDESSLFAVDQLYAFMPDLNTPDVMHLYDAERDVSLNPNFLGSWQCIKKQ